METKKHYEGLDLPSCIALYEQKAEELKNEYERPLRNLLTNAIIDRLEYFDAPKTCGEDKWSVILPFGIENEDDEGNNKYWCAVLYEKNTSFVKIGRCCGEYNEDWEEKSMILFQDILWLYKCLYCMGFFDEKYEKNFFEGEHLI